MKWEQEHLSNGRYTLEMVRIDDKVKRVITDIKLAEAAIAHKQNTVSNNQLLKLQLAVINEMLYAKTGC